MGILGLMLYGGIALIWIYLFIMNLMELYKVATIKDAEDQAGQNAWIIWGTVFMGFISGVFPAVLVGWVLMGWIWPLDMDKATYGDHRLYGIAGTTAGFVLGLLLLTLCLFCILFGLMFASM